jgi:hypothetical protein
MGGCQSRIPFSLGFEGRGRVVRVAAVELDDELRVAPYAVGFDAASADPHAYVQLGHWEAVLAEESPELVFEVGSAQPGGFAQVDQRFAQGLVASLSGALVNGFG